MTCFLRLVEIGDKGEVLRSRLPASPPRFDVPLSELRDVPTSPFSYWVGSEIRRHFTTGQTFESGDRYSRQGLATTDDFRFVRLWWELAERENRDWPSLLKGGEASKFYSPIPTLLLWRDDGAEIKQNVIQKYPYLKGNYSFVVKNETFYGKPGISWPLRRNFACYATPSGCVPSVAGKLATAPSDELCRWLAVLNSRTFDYLLRLFSGEAGGVQFEAGLIGRVPVPPSDQQQEQTADRLGRRGWSAKRSVDTVVEVSHAFVVPALLQVEGDGFDHRVLAWAERVAGVEAELERVQFEIDELCFELYGISEEDRRAITEGFGVTGTDDEAADDPDEDESDAGVELDPVGLAAGLVSWAVGVAVGRFDIRLATGERDWPVEPDPFDPLPVCSPGMLTSADGLPATSLPEGYPLVPSPVLVDDPGHERDITARVRAVFDVVFGDDADIWWSDIGAALDARNGVEGWLRRGFFDHHLKTYSKSRRKAPLMWPIGTKSGSYQVWLYAHSVTPDSLFRLLGDVIEPKLAAEQRQLSDLTQEFGPSPTASQRRTLDVQQRLVDEITELRDEIRAIAALWHPDLNDGIVIVLAPLWRLFAQHRAWAKELKDRWVKLAKGDYDWAQLAMHIWPERVIPKCATDRSLAIAHNLEDVFWAQDDTNPDKWHPRTTPTTPIDQLTADRTNPTITTTRNHPNP